MDKIKYYILATVIMITSVSCSSLRYVEYDIVRPPQILLPGAEPIAVVYNVKDTAVSEIETLPTDTVRGIFFGMMMTSLKNSIYSQAVESYMMDTPTGKAIEEDHAEILAEYLGRKSIITLNELAVSPELFADTLDSDWYLSTRRYILRANITMIIPESNGPMTYTVNDTLAWQGSGYSLEEAITSLPEQRETIAEAMVALSNKVSEIYLPYREKVGRIYFVSIYPLMRKADKYWKEKKYDEASYLWEYVFENTTNKALQGKAAANMAIYEELNDRYESAIMWARMAFALFSKKHNFYDSHIAYMSDYIHQLKIRVKEKSMLDKNSIYAFPKQ